MPDEGPGAGQGEGDHVIEVDISIDELAEILGEELELPNIQPRGDNHIEDTHHRYNGISKTGPDGLRHVRRTLREGIKRQITSGIYNPQNPVILPHVRDKRYRTFRKITRPQAKAVIIYMMDVSGSMGAEQKEIVRTESFWINAWLTKQYKGLEARFIVHDAAAREVDKETFFSTRESGGTMISSALKLCKSIIENDYSPQEWNIYPFYFSDGDNWSQEDNDTCISLIKNHILPWSNMFAYGQVESQFGSGHFINELRENFDDESKVILSEINSKDDIINSIKEFLGKGH